MPDRIETKPIDLAGGLITSMGALEQAINAPGSAVRMVNFEPTLEGGYRRIRGFAKYSAEEVPGDGPILGVAVFGNGVLACRGADVYYGLGTTWTKINGDTAHTNADIYRFARYNFSGVEKIAFCDGQNRPATFDGTTYTSLSDAPQGAEMIAAFARRLWFSQDNILTFSAVTKDDDYTAASGAGVINVGDRITGLRPWRDQLIVFCQNRILRITGDSADNFSVRPVTDNMGCVHTDTIVEVGGDVVFWGPDGLRTLSGTDRIGDFNLSSISRVISRVAAELESDFPRLVAVPIRGSGQVRIFGYHPTFDPGAAKGIVGTLRLGSDDTLVQSQEGAGWEWGELLGMSVRVADSFYSDTGTEIIVFGNGSGYVFRMDVGTSFDGLPIHAVYQTPHLIFDDPNVRKVFRRLRVYLRATSAYDMRVALRLDNERPDVLQPGDDRLTSTEDGSALYDDPHTLYDVAVYGGEPVPYFDVPLVGSGFAGSFQFVSYTISTPFVLTSISVDVTHTSRK